MVRRLVPALAAAVLALGALSGCATSVPPAESPSEDPGGAAGTVPEGSADVEVDAAWLAGGSIIAIVTYGSSTPDCAPRLDDAVLDAGVLVVTLAEQSENVCDGDLVPRGLLVGTPDGVEPAEGLDVQVVWNDRYTDVELAPYTAGPVDEYQPSAGWAGDEHIAILTWGSSSCAPSVESTTVVSPTEIAVTFASPPADQVCTMDMAPRVAIATVDGEVSREATLSLGGLTLGDPGERDPGASIPIG